MRKNKIYAVDFDGTIVVDSYPDIGRPKQNIIKRLHKYKRRGDKLILWTCRTGRQLADAVEFCGNLGIVFDAVNNNLPENIAYYGNDTRKVFADHYIDDRNLFVLLLSRL